MFENWAEIDTVIDPSSGYVLLISCSFCAFYDGEGKIILKYISTANGKYFISPAKFYM